jgi:hypothetical protein
MRGVLEYMIELEVFVGAENYLVIGLEFDAEILIVGDLLGNHGTYPDGHFDSCLLLFLIIDLSIHLSFKFYNSFLIRFIINSLQSASNFILFQ